MWELDHIESWALKNWCFWSVVLEKTLESPLDSKEIQPVHLKGNQSWKFIRRTDTEAETPILWPPDAKNWLIGKDSDAGKDWRWEEKGTTEDEMDGWHHELDGHEFEQTLRVGDGQRSLACCSLWGCKESDMTEWLNWTCRIFVRDQSMWKESGRRIGQMEKSNWVADPTKPQWTQPYSVVPWSTSTTGRLHHLAPGLISHCTWGSLRRACLCVSSCTDIRPRAAISWGCLLTTGATCLAMKGNLSGTSPCL